MRHPTVGLRGVPNRLGRVIMCDAVIRSMAFEAVRHHLPSDRQLDIGFACTDDHKESEVPPAAAATT